MDHDRRLGPPLPAVVARAVLGSGLAAALLAPAAACADVVWPALALEDQILTPWVIAAGLAVEWPFVKALTRRSWRASLVFTLLVNLASTLAGIALIPLGGLAAEVLPLLVLSGEPFAPATWVLLTLVATLANTVVEGAVVRLALRIPLDRRTFRILFVANLLSVGLAVAALAASGEVG